MNPNPDYDASDELEYGIASYAWLLRGVYPPPSYAPDLGNAGGELLRRRHVVSRRVAQLHRGAGALGEDRRGVGQLPHQRQPAAAPARALLSRRASAGGFVCTRA